MLPGALVASVGAWLTHRLIIPSLHVMPPPVLEMLEAILHEEVAERPLDAREMVGEIYKGDEYERDARTEFGKWCDSVSGIEEVRARSEGA